MRDLFRLIGWTVVDLFRSRAALEAEIWTLRQQINVLRRTAPRKLSCRRHRGDGSVRRPNNLVSFALWPTDHGARPAADSMVWCHIASERRMDRKSAHGSLWLGTSSPLSDPRSGWGLWRGLHPTTSINGHSRSTDVATFPMAKRIC